MYNKKRKQKIIGDKQIYDDIKQVKNLLAEAKLIIENCQNNSSYQKALTILNKAIIKASSVQVSNSYHLYYFRGICYLNLHQLNKAQRDFVESISLADEKGKIQIYNSLGRCKVQMSSQDPSYLQQALKCYEKALQYSKNTDGQAFFKLASIHKRQKNNIQAIKYYTSSLKYLKPMQQFQTYTERGLCYRQIGEIKNSIDDFVKACQFKNSDSQCHFNLGVNYLLTQKYQLAVQQFDLAIQLNPNEPKNKNYKGMSLYLSGQYQSCLYAYRQTIKLYQDKNITSGEVGECWYNLANALYHIHQEDQALIALKMACNYDVSEEQLLKIYYSEGLSYQSKKNIEAINKFSQCLSLIGENKQHNLYLSTLYHLAISQCIHKKYNEAISNINKVIDEGCCQQCVYQLRGHINLDNEKYSEALKDFQTLLSMNPNSPEVYYYLGMSKVNLGDVSGAIADFFQSISFGSRNNNLMTGLSFAYLKAGKLQKSLVYANLALEKQPNNEEFLIQRSKTFMELGDNTKGIQDLTKALTINNKNPLTYYQRGLSYYKNKQYQEAIDDLKKSLQCQPSEQIQHDIHYLIGVSYANMEQYQLAIQPFTQSIKLQNLPKYYHQRAKCYILTDRCAEALQDLNEVIIRQPRNAYAYFRRALALKQLKMYDESAQNFLFARDLSPEDPKLIINKKQIYEIKYRKLCQPGQEQ